MVVRKEKKSKFTVGDKVRNNRIVWNKKVNNLKDKGKVGRKRKKKGRNKNVKFITKFDYTVVQGRLKGTSRIDKEVRYEEVREEVVRKDLVNMRFKGEERDFSRTPLMILGGMMMREGKSYRVESILNKVMLRIKKYFRKRGMSVDMKMFFERVCENASVKVGLFKRKISGVKRGIPVLLPKYKVNRESWKRVVRNARMRTERTFEERLAGELIDVYKNEGRTVKSKVERYKEVVKSKVWLKHLRF